MRWPTPDGTQPIAPIAPIAKEKFVATSTTKQPAKKAPAKTANGKAAAKQPADRKPKEEKAKAVKDGDGYLVTFRGIELTVDPEVMNDYEFIEDSTSGEDARMPRMLRRLFGDEKHDEIKEALRNPETGRVPFYGERSMSEFIEKVFEAINPNL